MLRIKDNVDLKGLEKFGFEKREFGLYGPGDYIPEYWYVKHYRYKNKRFYLKTSSRYFFEDRNTLTSFTLYKITNTRYDKIVPFNRLYKIVRIIIKDLIQVGLVEKVKE